MREVITMFRYTRMVVLVALTAGLYAAALIPFKVAPLIPGFTEIRPAIVLPVICSLLFGPAAAWGAAIGNVIGDAFGGMFGPGSFFGCIGNFLYAYIPYRVWQLISRDEPTMRSPIQILKYVSIAILASLICGVVIGWGVDLMGFVPFVALGNTIAVNNILVSGVLGPILLALLYARLTKWGVSYKEIMEESDRSTGKLRWLGYLLLWIGGISALVLGNILSIGLHNSKAGEVGLGLGLVPSMLLIVLGALLV